MPILRTLDNGSIPATVFTRRGEKHFSGVWAKKNVAVYTAYLNGCQFSFPFQERKSRYQR